MSENVGCDLDELLSETLRYNVATNMLATLTRSLRWPRFPTTTTMSATRVAGDPIAATKEPWPSIRSSEAKKRSIRGSPKKHEAIIKHIELEGIQCQSDHD